MASERGLGEQTRAASSRDAETVKIAYRVTSEGPSCGYTHQQAALIRATAPPTFKPNSTGLATLRIGTTSSATASTATAAAEQTAKRSHHGARSRSPHRPRTTTANIAR